MSDIFISYSRKDSEQALQLAERLQGEGMSVWIDQRGIEAAKSWSAEIVNAIEASKAFLVLLSSHSIESDNVARELSLAFESKRPMLPVAIEDVNLPANFKYPLAGIQRVAYTQHDAITQALIGCGVTIAKRAEVAIDSRKALMILPFEDLSPTRDNEWFADGLASELISALSKIKSLRLIDWNTSKILKERKLKTVDLAAELSVRYFLEGSVRKFGDQIKITSTLLDIHEGEYLWQFSEKGTMADIFNLQEAVAQKVLSGLKLHLTKEESSKIEEWGTTNPEAYELLVKANQIVTRSTREDFIRGIRLLQQAQSVDPNYARAYVAEATQLLELYRVYDRDPNHLARAQWLANHAVVIDAKVHGVLRILSGVHLLRGETEEALRLAEELTTREPESDFSFFFLGFVHAQSGNELLAIPHYERSLVLKSDGLIPRWNLLLAYERTGDPRLREFALDSLPFYDQHLRLNPDDDGIRVQYANLLYWLSRTEEARKLLHELSAISDANSLYNLACLGLSLQDNDLGLFLLKRAFDAGFSDIENVMTDPDLNPVRDLPEFIALVHELQTRLNLPV
jgi:adenylate cyclase